MYNPEPVEKCAKLCEEFASARWRKVVTSLTNLREAPVLKLWANSNSRPVRIPLTEPDSVWVDWFRNDEDEPARLSDPDRPEANEKPEGPFVLMPGGIWFRTDASEGEYAQAEWDLDSFIEDYGFRFVEEPAWNPQQLPIGFFVTTDNKQMAKLHKLAEKRGLASAVPLLTRVAITDKKGNNLLADESDAFEKNTTFVYSHYDEGVDQYQFSWYPWPGHLPLINRGEPVPAGQST